MYGSHLIRAYSKTQATVSLSSAEAELAAIVRASSEVLGMGAIYKDLGIPLMEKALIQADASAALGIVQRRGAGAIRHLDTRLLGSGAVHKGPGKVH